jgi:hypothetical protein
MWLLSTPFLQANSIHSTFEKAPLPAAPVAGLCSCWAQRFLRCLLSGLAVALCACWLLAKMSSISTIIWRRSVVVNWAISSIICPPKSSWVCVLALARQHKALPGQRSALPRTPRFVVSQKIGKVNGTARAKSSPRCQASLCARVQARQRKAWPSQKQRRKTFASAVRASTKPVPRPPSRHTLRGRSRYAPCSVPARRASFPSAP